MPNAQNPEIVARRVLPIFYLIDTSGSMYGERIAALNVAMQEATNTVRDLYYDYAYQDAEVKFAVMKFATRVEWVTKNGLVSWKDFFWEDIKAGGGN